ncbi:MAG: Divalent-cation tolerance protein CutA [Methanomethylovorans sp. PtaU1.Bin093]|uniref:divalent-cation tolerance protein CutA n=1 Tax=Methanomethylovorans sp. PtaU1.Bin093 TaxID=1811679 RepID=UPI0009CDA7C8|nr:divalent-cation tolerance protein CutA [Methanomethylovorans sp. PtaU1.Bin093]OPY20084.1 MAG: Divalent-cation tolerance protein CutA [Methanomethylovorans sp. PtaU1.Bin093]
MIIIVHTTTANMDEAKSIANVLVKKGFAACVNMHPITSVYKWKGNVEEEGEVELSIKTTSEMLEKVKNTVNSMHSYELPALIWWPVDGEDKYAQWIIECVRKK